MTDRPEPAPHDDDLFAPPEPQTPSDPAPPAAAPPEPSATVAATSSSQPSAYEPAAEPGPVGEPDGTPTPPRAGRRRPRGAGVAVVVSALVAGLVGGVVGDRLFDTDDRRPADASLPVAASSGDGGERPASRPAGSVAAIAATALPSVVSLEVQRTEGVSSGSGFVLREDGYILTNNHVVAGATGDRSITVAFADGSEHPAELVGATADYDLAVVRVELRDLRPLVLGDSDAVVVGDAVLAVGAPLGLESTVTSGIVSALHRPVQAGDGDEQAAFIDAIQTDAAINPGNSGGPLLNAAGEVVGINSAIAQTSGTMQATGNIGLGFAIPANQARHTAQQLIETGRATYPVIGVLLDSTYRGEGVQVATEAQEGQAPVTPGGPADQAGVRPGDVILAIDGRPVSRSDELIVAIRARQPGDAVTLRVRSGGQERDVRVVLREQASR